jgi:hypothetical protein
MDNLYLAIDRASLADDELLRMAVEDMRSAFSSCLLSSASSASTSSSFSSFSSSSSFAAPTSKYPIETLISAATAVIDRNVFDCVLLEDSLALLVMIARDETSPHVVAAREPTRQFDAAIFIRFFIIYLFIIFIRFFILLEKNKRERIGKERKGRESESLHCATGLI